MKNELKNKPKLTPLIGNNTLYADGGNNILSGGTGNDTLTAVGGGNNYLDGGNCAANDSGWRIAA